MVNLFVSILDGLTELCFYVAFFLMPISTLFQSYDVTRSNIHARLEFNLYKAEMLNSLPNDTILDWSKLKAFADDKINVLKKMIFVFDRVENIAGKGENAGNQHFLLFPQCFLHVHRHSSSFQLMHTFNISSSKTFNSHKSEILLYSKELYDDNAINRLFYLKE